MLLSRVEWNAYCICIIIHSAYFQDISLLCCSWVLFVVSMLAGNMATSIYITMISMTEVIPSETVGTPNHIQYHFFLMLHVIVLWNCNKAILTVIDVKIRPLCAKMLRGYCLRKGAISTYKQRQSSCAVFTCCLFWCTPEAEWCLLIVL